MSSGLRPAARRPRYPLMNTLSTEQRARLQTIIRVYVPDYREPAAAEVLMALVYVCELLDVPAAAIEQMFSQRVLRRLRRWEDLTTGRRGAARRSCGWLLLPDAEQAQPCRVDKDGIVHLIWPGEQAGKPAGEPARKPAGKPAGKQARKPAGKPAGKQASEQTGERA